MPYVNVRMVEGPSDAQKAELIAGVTDVVAGTLGLDPQAVWVVVEEVAAEDWGVGGRSIAARRADAG